MNPFHSPLPVTVYLRDRLLAVVERADGASGFPLVGRLKQEGAAPECWRADGRYCESGEKHPLDIVGEIVGKNEATGVLDMVPYAPAAGAKGATS